MRAAERLALPHRVLATSRVFRSHHLPEWAREPIGSCPVTSPSRSRCSSCVCSGTRRHRRWRRPGGARLAAGLRTQALGATPLSLDPIGGGPRERRWLPGRPPRSGLSSAGWPASAGAWSKPSTSCRRWRYWSTRWRSSSSSNSCSTPASRRSRPSAARSTTCLRHHSATARRVSGTGRAFVAPACHGRCLLCLAHGRDRRRRDGVPAAVVLRRIATNAMAVERERIHRLRGAIQQRDKAGVNLTVPPLDRPGASGGRIQPITPRARRSLIQRE